MSLLLYGANGYTGQLITELAKDYALTPILAGRNAEKIKLLAKRHGLSWRVFDLDDEEALQAGLEGIKVVLHAAGPFMHTAKPMMQACLAGGVHYLDITGELPVFERAHRLDGEARERGITLMPGVGFDVVPTDCMALYLKHRLPDATHLKLAFAGLGGGSSHGTALTALESLGKPGAVRENGEIVKVEVGHKSMWVPFLPDKKRLVMTIPWGDVSTAYYTTGIPNIETYMGVSPKT